jgi:hypothetical protein
MSSAFTTSRGVNSGGFFAKKRKTEKIFRFHSARSFSRDPRAREINFFDSCTEFAALGKSFSRRGLLRVLSGMSAKPDRAKH